MLLQLLIILVAPIFFGGAFAGIATLIITRKTNFFIEIFRLLIGAIGGYEGLVIFLIFNLEDKNPKRILKFIIYAHHPSGFLIPTSILGVTSMLGVIGASIAIFMMRKVFRWRS
jgi:hypothetical protein